MKKNYMIYDNAKDEIFFEELTKHDAEKMTQIGNNKYGMNLSVRRMQTN